MNQQLSPNDPFHQWQSSFEMRTTAALKLLLESKHLYQSVSIIEETGEEVLARLNSRGHDSSFLFTVSQLLQANWDASDNSNRRLPFPAEPGIRFTVPGVKLFCRECDRLEAFNSISAQDFLERGGVRERFGPPDQAIQVFALSFLCQSCKSVPEVFLVRRQGSKLTICGRAPIEAVDVPSMIPKVVRSFYSGAVVAHQSGQTLAGLFLLRTLIEQWARAQLPEAPSQADEALDNYMATLPEDFKGRFPSIRSLYGELSADIHSASGSSELFDKGAKQIVEHFEARRLFRL